MNDAAVLERLRRFLLITSALLLAGTVAELVLVGHTESFVQSIPFALCGLGLLALLAAFLRPRRAALLALRACMGLLALGGLFGVYEHVVENVEFQKEVHPGSTTGELLSSAVGGGNPLLAPCIMLLAAALAAAATYYHPALGEAQRQERG